MLKGVRRGVCWLCAFISLLVQGSGSSTLPRAPTPEDLPPITTHWFHAAAVRSALFTFNLENRSSPDLVTYFGRLFWRFCSFWISQENIAITLTTLRSHQHYHQSSSLESRMPSSIISLATLITSHFFTRTKGYAGYIPICRWNFWGEYRCAGIPSATQMIRNSWKIFSEIGLGRGYGIFVSNCLKAIS